MSNGRTFVQEGVSAMNQIEMFFSFFLSFLKGKKKPSHSSGGLGMWDRNAVELL